MEELRNDDPQAYSFLKDILVNKGVKWKEYKMVARETPENTVVLEKKLVDIK